MIPFRKISICIFTILLFIPAVLKAKDLQDIKKYSDFLFQNGYYTEASRQYLFLYYKSTEKPRKDYYLYRMGSCHLENAELKKAEKQFRGLTESESNPFFTQGDLYINFVRSIYFQKKFHEAAFEAENSSAYETTPELRELAGWAYINKNNWKQAGIIFTNLSNTEENKRYKKMAELLNSPPDFNRKSPLTAAILSAILPGAGHAYCGNWSTAVGSFVTNLIFGGLTAYSIYQKQWIYAGVFGFIETGWYSGNVVSAYQEANFMNRKIENDYKIALSAEFPVEFTIKKK